MKKVAILAAEGCVLSTIASPMDMFLQAGVMWNVTMGKRPDPAFEVKIVTSDGQPIICRPIRVSVRVLQFPVAIFSNAAAQSSRWLS